MKKNFWLLIAFALLPSISSANDRIQELLLNKNFSKLEEILSNKQLQFEKGELTEVELRNSYRPFYDLDEPSENQLIAWANSATKSYIAHLSLGIHYKKLAQTARGDKYVSKTSPENLAVMHKFFDLANMELTTSLKLSPKPYLSIYHLLDISIYLGTSDLSRELMLKGTKIYPKNELMRYRYANSLLPRWGGTYEAFDDFILKCKLDGVPEYLLKNLEAMKHSDIGLTLQEKESFREAKDEYIKALQLGTNGNGSFYEDYLKSAKRFLCEGQTTSQYCK